MISETRLGISSRLRAHQFELLGIVDQRHQSAGHGIARGVVAADDQKPDRADEFARVEIPGRLRMRQHRDEVEGRRRVDPRIPQLAEIFAHLDHLGGALFLRMHDRIGRGDIGDRDIRPPGQFGAILPGEIEQRRQHHVGEIGRDALDPVKGLVARQRVQHVGRALADQRFEIGEVRRRHDRRHGLAMRGVAGRVHADEIRPLLPLGLVGHLDTAELRGRGIVFMVEFDGKDVVVARDRPIRAERRGLAIMHGIVAAQLREQRPPDVVLIEAGVADVDRRKAALQRLWLGHRLAPTPSPLGGRSAVRQTIGERRPLVKQRGNPFRHAGKRCGLRLPAVNRPGRQVSARATPESSPRRADAACPASCRPSSRRRTDCRQRPRPRAPTRRSPRRSA